MTSPGTNKQKGTSIDTAIGLYHTGGDYSALLLPPDLQHILDAYIADGENDVVMADSIQSPMKLRIGDNYYVGKIDQLRRSPRGLQVWDIKYSKKKPKELLEFYLPQLMLYAYAFECRIGGIVNVRNYLTTDPVHIVVNYPCPSSLEMHALNLNMERQRR